MSAPNETPRQKMIGMMYLVLTAMLALNVSVEVLKSFLIVNDAAKETNKNFQNKVESMYVMFHKAYLGNPQKTEEAWNKAQSVQKSSKVLYDYINQLKYEVIAVSEKISIEEAKKLNPRNIGRQDNYDDPTRFFIGESQSGNGGKAFELKKHIETYLNELRTILGADKSKVNFSGLNTNGTYYDASGKKQNWQMQYFYHTIIVADLAILNNLQTEVLNAEYDAVAQLYASVSDDDFKFDNISARAIANSNYVLVGNNYEAEIFVAAFDSKSHITATIGGTTYQGDSGRIKYVRTATTAGNQSISGQINVPSTFGTKSYPFTLNYIVAEPMATVSADAMNVMYVGVDNPVSAMAGGVSDANTRVAITNGSLTKKGAGSYTARVNTPGSNAIVSVYALNKGKEELMGSRSFRVKRIPDPIARINGQSPSIRNIDKNTLANAGGLLVSMQDFEFQLSLQVGAFALQVSRNQELSSTMRSNGNKFTSDMVDNIKRCKRGDKVFITDVTARMPEGNRLLGDMILTIK
ncbi:MAG: gliding motility protein GldM [Bacteroidales bacterium]